MALTPYAEYPPTRERVLRTLTAAEAADTGRWHSQHGDYRTAAVWHQLAHVLQLTHTAGWTRPAAGPEPDPCKRCGGDHHEDNHDEALAEPTQQLTTLGSPQAVSHAPTTCAYAWDTSTLASRSEIVCGELIRWSPNRMTWVHVNDGRLGLSAHEATPPEVAPPTRRIDG